MKLARLLAALSCVAALTIPAAATNLVTGNGFGFAVVNPDTAAITKLYSHPYSFMRPDPTNPLSEGIETPNFLKSLAVARSLCPQPDRQPTSRIPTSSICTPAAAKASSSCPSASPIPL